MMMTLKMIPKNQNEKHKNFVKNYNVEKTRTDQLQLKIFVILFVAYNLSHNF